MTLSLIFDDTMIAPPELRDLIGLERFGSLVFQRRSRAQATSDVANKAGVGFVHLTTDAERDALIERLRNDDEDRLFVYAPSHLIPACTDDSLVTLLQQVAYSPSNLHIPRDGAHPQPGWTMLRAPLLREYLIKLRENAIPDFFESHRDILIEVRDRVRLIDITDERALLDYLSGQFDARHFNSVAQDDYTVTKRSTDRAKLKREFDFYHSVPPGLQMFLVQPFDFKDDGKTASYRMERLAVPDMALQWVQGAFQQNEFERFLKHILYFIAQRPSKRVSSAEAASAQNSLYVTKVTERIAMLKNMQGYSALASLFEQSFGGIDRLLERYRALLNKALRHSSEHRLVIGHGDPCFSNILYSKTNQCLKLIDPRGADSTDGLYTDPYYDLAKLSHSIHGGYDFINQGRFDISVDESLRPKLTIENPSPLWAGELFDQQIERDGFDPYLTRLYEASLFISMLPLHMDRPRKVLGFALRGAEILDQLSTGKSA